MVLYYFNVITSILKLDIHFDLSFRYAMIQELKIELFEGLYTDILNLIKKFALIYSL